MKRLIFLISVLIFSFLPALASYSPQGLTLQGTILDPANNPVESSSVSFTIQVKSSGSESCVLFEETQNLNMSGSGGFFSLTVGAGTRTGVGFQLNSTLPQVFSNSSAVIAGLTCASGSTYTPVSGDSRKVLITFDDGSGPETITQSLDVKSVPYAIDSNLFAGKDTSQYLQYNNSGRVGVGVANPLEKLDVEGSIVSGPKGVGAGEAGAIKFEELAANGTNTIGFRAPDALAGDVLWQLPDTDGTGGQILQTNGSGVLSWTNNSAGSDNLGNHTATSNLIMSTNDIQMTNDQLVRWGAAYITGHGGNNNMRFHINGVEIARFNTVNGLLGIGTNAPSEKLDVEGSVLSGPKGTAAGDGGAIKLEELAANGTNTIGFRSPDALAGDVLWQLPSADGSNGQVLSTNGSGVLSWTGAGAGDFLKDGSVAMTGVLKVPAGSAGAPSIAYSGDTNTGFYFSTDEINLSVNGVNKAKLTPLGLANPIPFGTGYLLTAGITAGSPPYTFYGDSNTGLYTPGADMLAVTTGGSERLRVDSSGNVGIGTTTPATILDLNTSFFSGTPTTLTELVNKISLWKSVGVPTYGLGASTNSLNITAGGASGAINLYTGGANHRMNISSTGNVGIGTDAPTVKLDVRDGVEELMSIADDSNRGKMQLHSPGNLYLMMWHNGSNAEIIVNGGDLLINENVGIGASAPASKLHVDDATSGVCVTSDGVCGAVPAGGEVSAETVLNTGADYAEYFESEDDLLKEGDLVGLNSSTGKARRYQVGDNFLGIVSSDPGVIGNSALRDKDNVVLVALVGQVEFNSDQVIESNGQLYTKDKKSFGLLLSTGKAYLNMSSVDNQQSRDIAEIKDNEIKDLKARLKLLEKTVQKLLDNKND